MQVLQFPVSLSILTKLTQFDWIHFMVFVIDWYTLLAPLDSNKVYVIGMVFCIKRNTLRSDRECWFAMTNHFLLEYLSSQYSHTHCLLIIVSITSYEGNMHVQWNTFNFIYIWLWSTAEWLGAVQLKQVSLLNLNMCMNWVLTKCMIQTQSWHYQLKAKW